MISIKKQILERLEIECLSTNYSQITEKIAAKGYDIKYSGPLVEIVSGIPKYGIKHKFIIEKEI